jgi:uncharacterized protein YqfB (UPF0267 family)
MENSIGTNKTVESTNAQYAQANYSTNSSKVKTTILIDKTLKKLAQMHALQNDMTLQELVERALRKMLGA